MILEVQDSAFSIQQAFVMMRVSLLEVEGRIGFQKVSFNISCILYMNE